MANLNMSGPFVLTDEEITKRVEEGKKGNYAYGYINDKGVFIVMYVGRSDSDLRKRIAHGISEYADNSSLRYEYFKFSYASSAKEAYEKECRNYHEFRGDEGLLINDIHPATPDGCDCRCPICGQ